MGAIQTETLLAIRDVATLLGVSPRTVAQMRAGGKLPAPDLTIGRLPRWRRASLEEWIDGQAVRTGREARKRRA